MANVSITVDDETLKKIIYFYKDDEVENKNPHALFVAKSNDTTITVYKSKKVLFQGKNAETEARIFQAIPEKKTSANARNLKSSFPVLDPLTSIGSDEVGTGDYFGPVVVCAAYIDQKILDAIKQLKVGDSKAFTDNEIIAVAPKLFQIVPYSLLVVRNEKYNEMVEKGMNLNQMKAVLHQQAIQTLQKKINKNVPFIIDQFCSEENFIKYTDDPQFIKQAIFTTKAESKYLSVACASIMARYQFLQVMDELSHEVGMKLQKVHRTCSKQERNSLRSLALKSF